MPAVPETLEDLTVHQLAVAVAYNRAMGLPEFMLQQLQGGSATLEKRTLRWATRPLPEIPLPLPNPSNQLGSRADADGDKGYIA